MNIYPPRPFQPNEKEEAAHSASTEPSGRGEVVLVVEDDHRVRHITVSRLTDLGYRVLEASDATTAMEVLSKSPEIEIMFSDLVMPGGMSGLDLARRVRKLHPKIQIILTSGYSAELINQGDAELDLQLLRKPYRHAELAHVFREALKARAALAKNPA